MKYMKSILLFLILTLILSGCFSMKTRLSSDNLQVSVFALSEFNQLSEDKKQTLMNNLLNDLHSVDPKKSSQAARAFIKIGIPAIDTLLHDRTSYNRNANLLVEMGEDIIPEMIKKIELKKIFSRKSFSVGSDASNILAGIGVAAVPYLTEALKNENKRFLAMQALGNIGQDAEMAVPVLIEIIEAQDENINTAIRTLGKIGPNAKESVPLLMKIIKEDTLSDTNNWFNVGNAPIKALGDMGSGAIEAIPLLFEIKNSNDAQDRELAEEALEKMGKSMKVKVIIRRYQKEWQKGDNKRRNELEKKILVIIPKLRKETEKYNAMRKEIRYKTKSYAIRQKIDYFKTYNKEVYFPIKKEFTSLMREYLEKYGGYAIRDFAIEHSFLDLLENKENKE